METGTAGMWTCAFCTFSENPPVAIKCTMCGRAPTPQSELISEKWTCIKCTFVNLAGSSSCEVCQSLHPKVAAEVSAAAASAREAALKAEHDFDAGKAAAPEASGASADAPLEFMDTDCVICMDQVRGCFSTLSVVVEQWR